ncbi:rust resistance kinase Lr10-like [Telopea speciosissima]|uniref:rust resistance kinase Lr10-like n=1 Tax=Telopea speciosissima TaxID=54955 RepID=UPI001CC6C6E7|nr:rust resistance kinase Lr10-like [Telopea speciosissima]
MVYLQKTQKTHVLQILILLNPFLVPSRAQQQQPTGVSLRSTKPSFYYNLCAPSACNNITLTYPFLLPSPCHPSYFIPTCTNNETFFLTSPENNNTLRIFTTKFTADRISFSFFTAYNNLFSCGPISSPNFYYSASPLTLSLDYAVGTHLNCTTTIPAGDLPGLQTAACIGCPGQDPTNVCYYAPGLVTHPNCERFYIFTKVGFNISAAKDLRGYLQKGFELRFTKTKDCLRCENTGGRCGVNPSLSGSYVCFCHSNVHRFNCSDGMIEDITKWGGGAGVDQGRKSSPSKVLIASVSASVVVFLALLATVVALFFRCRHRKINQKKKEAISNLSPTRYSYFQIKKFTNKFSSKLGEGGYGSLYKGIIHRKGFKVPVAIKLLKSKQSQKQFMNEVATVGNVHHNNLLSLLGYCAQGDKRALVYEFMENGSLDKYIYTSRNREGESNDGSFQTLSHKQFHDIALETGRAILYLHQGCRSRILHCDIKPHNVLLDSNFTAKVADFGLARMIDKDNSHVLMSKARGTPGFMAPEMWLTSYGPVTEKSDVYSYGMLLLEMVGGRMLKYDLEAYHDSSQVYFPKWAFNKVKNGESLLPEKREESNASIVIDKKGRDEKEEVLLERICLVGLWCIQHLPSNRPYMDRVIQMLEGSIEIGIPLDPFPTEMDTDDEN